MNYTNHNFTYTKSFNKKILKPKNIDDLKEKLKKNHIIIGNLRSYGDTAVGKGNHISMLKFNKILKLNKKKKIIEVESGVILSDFMKYCLQQGLILTCMPGCKYVSIGGMIANNISGKLSNKNKIKHFVYSLKIINKNGKIIECSKNKNKKLFNLTIGGKGRTGPIISTKLKLEALTSNKIYEKKIYFDSYLDFYNKLNKVKNFKYVVTWLDFTSIKFTGIVFFGKHMIGKNKKIQFKFNDVKLNQIIVSIISSFIKSKIFTKIFNFLFKYKCILINSNHVGLNDFFFPQNKIKNWNSFFKEEGFIQFQFYFNKKYMKNIVENIKKELIKRNLFSNFTLLKLENFNKFSLSLDFPIKKNSEKINKFINDIVIKLDLDVELSKDISLSKLNKKTLINNPIFNEKNIKYFNKNYKSHIFKRLLNRFN